MQLHRSFFLTALASACVRAQNSTGSFASTVDVKNLSNWAPCAQECLPLAFGPPVGCGSLSNTSCICSNIAFDKTIAPCVVATCSLAERRMNEDFSNILCGVRPPKVYPAIATINAAVSVSVVSAAAATPSSLGDPAQLSSYPLCAQKCTNQNFAIAPFFDYGCDVSEVACLCQPPFRARAAACEEIICDLQEFLKIQALAEQLCGPFYQENATLGSAVSSAIVSATSAALAATQSKVPTNSAEYPLCGQVCNEKYLPGSGCGALTNRTCICGSEYFNSNLGQCIFLETKCSRTDLEKVSALANELCFPVGGSVSDFNTSFFSGTGSTSNTSTSLPSSPPFTGQAPAGIADGIALPIMLTVSLFGLVVLSL